MSSTTSPLRITAGASAVAANITTATTINTTPTLTPDSPPILRFHRPLTRTSPSCAHDTLVLTNTHSWDHVAFKLHPTNPARFSARPDSGTVAPGESVAVAVTLTAETERPPKEGGCGDGIKVRSILVPRWVVDVGERGEKAEAEREARVRERWEFAERRRGWRENAGEAAAAAYDDPIAEVHVPCEFVAPEPCLDPATPQTGILAVSPRETISFRRPFDKVVKRTMTLTNTTAETVAFKVRTTAPRAYCVRPNTGRIPPGATVEVEVMLQPNPETKGSMTRGSDCKDKFQVMSLVLPKEVCADDGGGGGGVAAVNAARMEGLWERAEAMQKQMQQPDDGSARLLYLHKLRCEFLPAMDSAAVDTFLDEYLRRATSDPSPRPPPPLAVSPPSTTLTFQRPFTAVVPRTLTLTNTTASDTVLFKAKTTAPRQYCVRPNLGRIPAGATVAVQVLLEPNPPEKRGTDKLMFESVVVPKELAGVLDGNDDDDGEVKARVAQAWKFVDAALARRTDGGGGEGVVHRHKIRCEFVPAGDVVAKDSGAGKAAKTVKESKTAAATAKKLTTVGDKARASQQGKAEKEAPPKVSDSSRRRYATDKPSFLERLFPCCWSREG